MLCTCHAHAMCMPCTCHVHAMHLPCAHHTSAPSHMPCVMCRAACLRRAELVVLGGGLVDAVVKEGGEGEAARLLQRGVAAVEPCEDLAQVRQVVVVAHLRVVRCGNDGREASGEYLGGRPRRDLVGRSRREISPRCVGGVVGGALDRSAGRAACATTYAAAQAPRARRRTPRSSAS